MQEFKYKTSFSSKILSCSSLESNEWVPWNISQASLDSLEGLMPSSVDLNKNIDLLGVAFNAAVVNRFNRNGDGISTQTALAIKDYFVNKPTNIEHERHKVVGHIVGSSFSDFNTNKLLSDEEVTENNGAFNIALAAVVYKTVNKQFAVALENAQTEGLDEVISASWEIGFNDYAIALGSKDVHEAQLITEPDQIKEFEGYLLANGGKGKTKDGVEVYRLVVGEVYPLGIGFTTNPAADVNGLHIIEPSKDENLDLKSEENISHLNKTTVNTEKTNPRQLTMENKELIQQLEEILDDKLSKKEYAKETVASMAQLISDAIKDKSDHYVEEKKLLEEEKQRISQAEEQFKTSVKEMEEKLTSTEEKLDLLEAEKQEREAKARFNSRMTEIDEHYELDDADRKIVASEITSLEEGDESFNTFKEKLEVMWKTKSKAYVEEHQQAIEDHIAEEVAKRLAEAEVAPVTQESESTEQIFENAEVEDEEAALTNNSAEISKQAATLQDQFKSVFNRDNVNIKY
jgi:hypothetical protein